MADFCRRQLLWLYCMRAKLANLLLVRNEERQIRDRRIRQSSIDTFRSYNYLVIPLTAFE
jgi:hypothetical protein